MERFQTIFHKNGLTQKQGEAILGEYASFLKEGQQTMAGQKAKATEAVMSELTKEWGDKTKDHIQAAQAAVQKFGGQDLLNYLNQTGLGNHPALIKAFAQIGSKISDDSALTGGKGTTPGAMDSVAAKAEINRLNVDSEFQKRLANRWAPGYQEAKALMEELFKRAYPNTPSEE
jgi:hypothetical protein